MQDERLHMIIGLILLPLIIGAVIAVLIIGDRPLRPTIHFQVEFDHVGQLKPGDEVRMANMVIGKVKHISFNYRKIDGHTKRRVRAHVWIYKRHQHQVWRNSQAFVSSAALIGARHLELDAPEGTPGLKVQTDDVIQGKSPAHMDRLLIMSYENLVATNDLVKAIGPPYKILRKRLDAVLDEVDRLKKHEARVRSLADRSEAVVKHAKQSFKILESSTDKFRVFSRLERDFKRFGNRAERGVKPLVNQVERLIDLFEALADALRKRVPAAVKLIEQRTQRMTRRFDAIGQWLKVVDRFVKLGKGTVGAMMKERELFDDFKASGRIIRQQIWNTLARPKKMGVGNHPAMP